MTNNVERYGKIGESNIIVGRFTYGFENLSIRQWGEGASLTIGSFCSLSTSINIFLGGNHRTDWTTTFPFGHIFVDELGGQEISGHPQTKGDLIIGDDVWIGHGVTIMSGISIGSGAVLATNATVVKDVEPYEIVGGNPAQPLKKRFEKEIVDLLLELSWWNLPLDAIKEASIKLSMPPTKELLIELIRKYRSR
ncbi:CatB-related O-acetyltransferase [Pseudomonas sp. WJP1]|uniref:CatB-related O-acetyltransferase n=1 Tax=Pseudomonas sp. WJP1 TaxID=2986947 RepID=UPI00234A3C21|nr:CatB-related O-acetyltransferase [Pseudomonas sp. WJP1]WCM48955.1 CatB-related O-acetyltransferase [Pseudomonas sp. WJP1]